MIPESETSECPEHKVKSKIGNIFVNEKILEEYSVKIHKIDPYFCEHYKKNRSWQKWVWIHIIKNCCLFYWISFSRRNWWKKTCWERSYFWGEMTKSTRKKNLVINLFELIRVKKGMIQTMKLVEHKYLSINLKTDNQTNETKYQKK